MNISPGLLFAAVLAAAPARAQGLPPLSDETLKQAGAALHVDVRTGRLAGITSSGPVAEVGAKIVEVLYGDFATDEWIAYSQRVDGEWVKPAVSQRLIVFGREGDRVPLVDAGFSPQARDELTRRLLEERRRAELLTGDMHVPDYLLRSTGNAVLYVDVQKSTPYDRARGNLSAMHVAKVVAVAQGDFKPGQTVEYIEESSRHNRFDPPASALRIVLLTHARSVHDGQMKWWLHDHVNYGYTEAGLKTLRADVARVRAKQAEKAGK